SFGQHHEPLHREALGPAQQAGRQVSVLSVSLPAPPFHGETTTPQRLPHPSALESQGNTEGTRSDRTRRSTQLTRLSRAKPKSLFAQGISKKLDASKAPRNDDDSPF